MAAPPIPSAVSDKIIAALAFNDQGLIPAIAQQFDTGEVLMMAWMNAEAVKKTLTEGQVFYYSRSRGELWRKGATSGHTQMLREFRCDCDNDTVLILVDQTGPACHTGQRYCFFNRVTPEGTVIDDAPMTFAETAE